MIAKFTKIYTRHYRDNGRCRRMGLANRAGRLPVPLARATSDAYRLLNPPLGPLALDLL